VCVGVRKGCVDLYKGVLYVGIRRACVCVYTFMYIHACTNVHIHVHKGIPLCVGISKPCVYMCIRLCIYMHACTCISVYTHIAQHCMRECACFFFKLYI
jgi:hypothetical protein